MRSDRRTGRVESAGSRSLETSGSRRAKANDYSHSPISGSRLSQRRLQELAGLLGPRDRTVLDALGAVRILSGSQLERLAFDEIVASARGRIRRRVLGRLIESGLVVTLTRRVGGVRAGSAGLVYALSAAGQRLLDLESDDAAVRRRRPHTPGALFLAHALAVSEVYVGLVEAARRVPGLRVERFVVEGAARWKPSRADDQILRPDALAILALEDVEDVWWLEVDRSTESLPLLNGMLHRYLEFAVSGSIGPGGVVPRVLISVTSPQRQAAVRGLIRRLPPPADELFVVTQEDDVVPCLVRELTTGEVEKPP